MPLYPFHPKELNQYVLSKLVNICWTEEMLKIKIIRGNVPMSMIITEILEGYPESNTPSM